MRRIAFGLVCVLAFPAVVQAQTPPPPRVAARLADSLARAFIAEGGAPSVAIAIVRGADTILLEGYGTADLENDVPATERSVYRIGSVTKQFTAAAVMQLVEQGKVKLDDSIGTFLPTLPEAWRPVTVRQLLNHTSGIPSYTSLGRAWQRRWGEEMSPDSIAALTAAQPMTFAPGADWRYNNTGYVLLGMLIEKVAGRPWGVDIAERFAKPLGLADTRDCQHAPLIPRRVRGYGPEGEGWANAQYLAMSQPYAAGALCSSVADMVRWNRALHTGGVVSAASYRLMTTPEGAAGGGTRRYGFGLGLDTLGGHTVISHGGGIHGFISANAWVPSAELSITVLTNSGTAPARAGPAGRPRAQLGRAALGIPLLTAPDAVPLAAADRERYVGVYALALPGGARDFTVAVAGEGITGQLAGQEAVALLHYGDHTFGASFDPALRIIFTVEGGRATSMTLVQNGARIVGPRK